MKEPAEGEAANITWARHSHCHELTAAADACTGSAREWTHHQSVSQVAWGCHIKEERLSLSVMDPRVCLMSSEFLLLTLKRSRISNCLGPRLSRLYIEQHSKHSNKGARGLSYSFTGPCEGERFLAVLTVSQQDPKPPSAVVTLHLHVGFDISGGGAAFGISLLSVTVLDPSTRE